VEYMLVPGGHPIKAWTSEVSVEEKALEQLKATARMPFIYHHLAVMPDVHWGMGATVGSVVATHGAGRKMSRGAAERTFSVADLELQTSGVNCRKDAGVLDEIPGAYKDIDDVMASQVDLVDIVHTLKQVCCVKG
jgi:RNA-splicing ligase RtcB